MVTDQPFAQPQDAINAEVFGQPCLDIGLGQLWIAVGIEQTLLGRDAQAGAIDVDRAALQHPMAFSHRQPGVSGQLRPNFAITGHNEFPAPPVEIKIASLARRTGADDDRPGIAQPDIAQRVLHQPHMVRH